MTDIARVVVRFLTCLVLTVLVIGLALVVPELGGHVYSPAAQRWGAIAQLALSTPVVLWGGWPHFVRGWARASEGNPDSYTLLGVAVAIAYAYSVVALLWPELFPDALRAAHGLVPVYFTVASVLVTLALLGDLRGMRRRRRAGS